MAAPAPEYELVLMLDPETPDERREQIASEARQRIESGGNLKHDNAWGMRKLAFEINQRTEADYRFFRFETGGSLLDDLNHNLRIADGVLRFRIFKVDPRNPIVVPPPPTPLSAGKPERGAGRRGDGPSRGRGDGPPRSRSGEADSEPVAAPVAPAPEPTATEVPATEPVAAAAAEEAPPAAEEAAAAEEAEATDAEAPAEGADEQS
ncbi:MAG: 30S ribosomal protein S6 [Solirubrobacterales bacterium]